MRLGFDVAVFVCPSYINEVGVGFASTFFHHCCYHLIRFVAIFHLPRSLACHARKSRYDCFIPPERSTPISGKAPNGTKRCKGLLVDIFCSWQWIIIWNPKSWRWMVQMIFRISRLGDFLRFHVNFQGCTTSMSLHKFSLAINFEVGEVFARNSRLDIVMVSCLVPSFRAIHWFSGSFEKFDVFLLKISKNANFLLTHEQWKNLGCLGYIGDDPTQLYGNYIS